MCEWNGTALKLTSYVDREPEFQLVATKTPPDFRPNQPNTLSRALTSMPVSGSKDHSTPDLKYRIDKQSLLSFNQENERTDIFIDFWCDKIANEHRSPSIAAHSPRTHPTPRIPAAKASTVAVVLLLVVGRARKSLLVVEATAKVRPEVAVSVTATAAPVRVVRIVIVILESAERWLLLLRRRHLVSHVLHRQVDVRLDEELSEEDRLFGAGHRHLQQHR